MGVLLPGQGDNVGLAEISSGQAKEVDHVGFGFQDYRARGAHMGLLPPVISSSRCG